jgi:hypothetical protein
LAAEERQIDVQHAFGNLVRIDRIAASAIAARIAATLPASTGAPSAAIAATGLDMPEAPAGAAASPALPTETPRSDEPRTSSSRPDPALPIPSIIDQSFRAEKPAFETITAFARIT